MFEVAAEVESLRQTVADNDLREALDAHFMATASQVAELRDIVSRHESSTAEVDRAARGRRPPRGRHRRDRGAA